MARKLTDTLITELASAFPDNTSGLITLAVFHGNIVGTLLTSRRTS